MNDFPANLLSGYKRFMQNQYQAERTRYIELATQGQTPEVLVIACCDSRAAPETIFNCGPGELFVTRNVANLVPPYTEDSAPHATLTVLEYGVLALRVKHIVVLGHGRCGGIQAVLDPSFEPLSSGNFVGHWMRQVLPLAQQIPPDTALPATQRQTELERISVTQSVKNLADFPWIQSQVEQKRLFLHGAWFDIASGELWIMDSENGEFTPARDLAADQ